MAPLPFGWIPRCCRSRTIRDCFRMCERRGSDHEHLLPMRSPVEGSCSITCCQIIGDVTSCSESLHTQTDNTPPTSSLQTTLKNYTAQTASPSSLVVWARRRSFSTKRNIPRSSVALTFLRQPRNKRQTDTTTTQTDFIPGETHAKFILKCQVILANLERHQNLGFR